MAAKRAFPKAKSGNVFGQARKPAKMFRAGLYARVSTNDQQTLPMQSRAMREYAARRGWTIAVQVREVGSGAAKREAREKLLEAARRREIDVVLVWRLDRWGRSVTDLLATLQELEHLGVGFVSLTEALVSPSGRAWPRPSTLEIFVERKETWGTNAGWLGSSAWATPGNRLHMPSQSERRISRRLLVRYVASFSEGNRGAVAESAGCRRSSFYNWYNGASTARVDLLLRMCHELGIPLTSLVTGIVAEPEAAARVETAMQARRRRGVAPQRTPEQIKEVLRLATKEQPAPSIREVAERLGYSTPTQLYGADKDMCKVIVRNFNKSGRNHWWRRRGAKSVDESAIQKALEESLSREIPVPVYRSAKAFGFETHSPLTARFPDLCRAIQAKRVAVKLARRSRVGSALKAALNEDPPPPLEQVASRLGYATGHSLRAWEPRLCARLIARRRGFAEQSKKALKKRLKAMLKENPPPSLREVHARLGITEAISYGNYPEIHRAISARHRQFQRQAKSANRAAPRSPGR